MPFINVYVKFQENKIFDWLAISIDEKMDIQQFFYHFSAIYLDQKYLKFEVTAHLNPQNLRYFLIIMRYHLNVTLWKLLMCLELIAFLN